jgi:hypothetical protein
VVWDQRPCIEAGSSLLQSRFQAFNEIVTILVVIEYIALARFREKGMKGTMLQCCFVSSSGSLCIVLVAADSSGSLLVLWIARLMAERPTINRLASSLP